MKIERTKNASRNLVFGALLKIYQLFIPFVMRSVVTYYIGIQYLGLNSLFYSILQVLNMAELGISGAIIFSMYRPIAEDDDETICALMQLYKIYYRIIGLIVLVAGICLMPFLPSLIKDEIPEDMNLYVLYLLNLGSTVLSYWMFAYKNCLLNAHQRLDTISKITLITSTGQYIFQFLSLAVFRNYYLYVISMLIFQIMLNILSAVSVNKMYPGYQAKGKLPKETVRLINNRIKDMFTAKLASTFSNSVDTLVISSFLGLTVLAIYNNYSYITSGIVGIVGIIYSACSAGIGNSLVVESKEKNYNDFKCFTFIISWVAGLCSVSLLCLYQTFMNIWMGDLLLDMGIVVCICVNYYISEISRLLNIYKDVAGLWHTDRFRPLATSIVNLVINLVLVNKYGLLGVLVGTVISNMVVNLPWLLHNLFSGLFKRTMTDYLIQLMYYVGVTVIMGSVTFWVCRFVPGNGILVLLAKMCICCIIPNIVYFIAYFKMKEFSQALIMGQRVVGNIIRRR